MELPEPIDEDVCGEITCLEMYAPEDINTCMRHRTRGISDAMPPNYLGIAKRLHPKFG